MTIKAINVQWQDKLRKPGALLQSRAAVLMVAVSLGVVTVVLSKRHIENSVAAYKARLDAAAVVPVDPLRRVVVPTSALTRGQSLTMNDLSIREIPRQYVDDNAIDEASVASAIGQRLEFDISAGKPLLWAHLENALPPTFSATLNPGSRALTIPVDHLNNLSGLLQPGDHIDLYWSVGQGDDRSVLPLKENLIVVATGHQTRMQQVRHSEERRFTTITVEVDPALAQRLSLAVQSGRIVAWLRHPEDDILAALGELQLADLLPSSESLPVNPAPPPLPGSPVVDDLPPAVSIEYIIGGS